MVFVKINNKTKLLVIYEEYNYYIKSWPYYLHFISSYKTIGHLILYITDREINHRHEDYDKSEVITYISYLIF